jgi:hypothetical protein
MSMLAEAIPYAIFARQLPPLGHPREHLRGVAALRLSLLPSLLEFQIAPLKFQPFQPFYH